jgi:hypothetical protein
MICNFKGSCTLRQWQSVITIAGIFFQLSDVINVSFLLQGQVVAPFLNDARLSFLPGMYLFQ